MNICKPNDIECIQRNKMHPLNKFVNKLSRKMVIRGCRVSFTEQEDALRALHSVGGSSNLSSMDDVKTILQASMSKTDSCDLIFEKSWNELLLPRKAASASGALVGMAVPPGMRPIIEKHIGHLLQNSTEVEGIVVNEKEMEELLRQGKVEALGGLPGQASASKQLQDILNQCKSNIGSGTGIGQCLAGLNSEIKKMMGDSFKSKKLSKIRKIGSEAENMIDEFSRKVNAETAISNEDAAKLKRFLNDLRKFKEFLKKTLDAEIPKMDISPHFDDSAAEQRFIDKFMKGAIGAWGAPEFVGKIAQSDYFKSKIRQGLKQLKTRKGQNEIIRQKGKLLAARRTIQQGMKKGMILDSFYRSKPPKQKEDIVWLVDTSGSMSTAYSFIQPIVDSMDSLGIKQKFFLGTEESIEVKPHSNFQDTLSLLSTHGTRLSEAYDDIKPKVGGWRDKTLIIYSDMEDAEPEKFEKKLNEVVKEGGKVLILNNETNNGWDQKYVDGVIGKHPIVEFENVDDFERMIDVLKQAAPIIKK